ncbi:MAG: PKD domain-containing protein, partial [Terriglobia bacterium]
MTGLTTGTAPAQITPATLSVTNYRLLSTQRLTRTQSEYTYAADLVNTGAAQPALTATAQSVSPGIQIVSGMGNLHFPGVLAGGSAASLNTFVVIVDRLGDDSFSNLKWSFNAPVANAGPDQTVPVGSTATLNGSGTTNPSGIGRLTYSWVFSSRPPGTRAALRDGSTSMPSFDPDVLGDYIITLTADNGAGSDTSSVTISTKSTKPVADAGRDQTVKPGSLVTLSGAASRDVDGNELTYAWTLIEKPSRSSAILNGATSVSPSFTADAEGTYIAQLIVTDVNGSSDPSTVSVTTFNTPPMANAGANQVVSRGATVQLSGAGSTDVDGDALTYKWSLLSVPTGSLATLNSTTVVNPTFVADLDGTYVAQLIVNDSSNDSAPSTVTITTNTVQAPTANAGPAQSLAHGATVTLNGSGTDPQSRPLTYSWSFTARPAGSNSVLSGATTQNPSFTADLPGTYIAQLIVNNGTLNSAPSTVTISSTNTAPVANAGPPQNPSVGSTVVLDGTASRDAENDPLTYKWSLLSVPPQSTAVLLSPDISSPTFIADVAGTYVAQLIVNDGFISSSPATVSITAGVTAALSLSPNPLNLLNSAADLTVTLPTAAGAGGQTVRFAALDSSVISVPGSISIAAGSTSGKVSVIPLALGSTLIIASSQGFQPATVEVNVTTPSIGISLSASVVGIARSVTGTLTLSAPAPPAGINVSILADVGGIVNPIALVHVNGGSSSATFQVTGLGAGTANLTASSAGYTSGAISITVSQAGAIIVQNNAIVGAGQTANLRVTLISPAPAGGVTVSLVSSNTAKMTVSPTIFFSQGATAPDTVAQITGIAFGTATVTASAPGFSGDTQSVQIGVNLSFNPNT